MDHENNAKINKMLEAAIACAAQDGLSNEEMEQIGGIFKTVVSIGKDIQVIFAEHGLSPDADIAKWQERINPIWQPVAGGCNLNRCPDVLFSEAGFAFDEIQRGYIAGPKFATYTYQGAARLM